MPNSRIRFFLLFKEFAFADHIAAIAFGEHILTQRHDGLAGNDSAADRCLDRDLKQLTRDQVLQPLAQRAAAPLGLVAMDDDRERIDRLAIDEDVFISTRSPSR